MIIRVAVLKGGLSAEREVSLVSGLEIAKALRSEGFAVTEIDANINLWEQLHAANPDVIVNALHGEWGENGKVQGILELYGKPYTHSGVTASRLAMDKHRAKAVLRDAGIHVPDGILIKRSELQHTHPMKPPYVAKPNGQGSSIGVYIVEEGTDAPPVEIQKDDAMGETVVVEKYIPGRELTVSVMDGRALAVTEILPNSDWYDYEAKYADGASEHILPAD
ncbi:MAG: D-alanine--D-alanine ligase, partial [Hyphomonadaceae bacterium]|nr:D-alanine--D-alanine ligase [Hyphomonadaceae bacterium]